MNLGSAGLTACATPQRYHRGNVTVNVLPVSGPLVNCTPPRCDSAIPEVPVLFDLALWREQEGGFAGWLEWQLGLGTYKMPAAFAKEWITDNRVIPLLDGLDELGRESWPACVGAINQFLVERPRLGMAVCCRNAGSTRLGA